MYVSAWDSIKTCSQTRVAPSVLSITRGPDGSKMAANLSVAGKMLRETFISTWQFCSRPYKTMFHSCYEVLFLYHTEHDLSSGVQIISFKTSLSIVHDCWSPCLWSELHVSLRGNRSSLHTSHHSSSDISFWLWRPAGAAGLMTFSWFWICLLVSTPSADLSLLAAVWNVPHL